ncbi:DUF4249 domain-containing protein [Tenacibaculum sp. M341]|nr:DUF4249 domain-containing protein [Tenacibaculum sp. M341]
MRRYNIWFCFILLISCIEPFDIENLSFERSLVVNAVITNEFKNHLVKLSNTVELRTDEIIKETGAKVFIVDDNQLVYNFIEIEEGKYESEEKFKADLNISYKLVIETKDGKVYESTPEQLMEENSIIESINRTVIEDDSKTKLVLSVDSKSFDENKKFYRYEYSETYKMAPNFWNTEELKVFSDTPPFVIAPVLKDYGRFCYPTVHSKKILLAETTKLSQNFIREFPVRTIPIDDIEISIRYSILIKQFSISQKTHNYYKLLEKFSVSNDVFSQTQVGKIPSNIKNIETGKQVVGYFDVSSISYKRIFFNRENVTDELYYNNISECYFLKPSLAIRDESPLLKLLESGEYVFYARKDPESNCPGGPYILVPKKCGDCRDSGPSTKPDFWID